MGILINLAPVQTWLAQRAAGYLSKKLHTRVEVAHVSISFKNRVLLKGIFIADQRDDTLLYAGEMGVRLSDWFYLRKKETPLIRVFTLEHAVVNLNRPANQDRWNYTFLAEAFDTGPKDKTKKQNEFRVDLRHLALEDVRVNMHDAWAGEDFDIGIGSFVLDARSLDLKARLLSASDLKLERSSLTIRDYPGGRPPRPRRIGPRPIDSTAFNPGGWRVNLDNLSLENVAFSRIVAGTTPAAGEFDPEHIVIRDVQLQASNLNITGDTLTARMNKLHATERSGFVLSKMSGDVRVSPNISEVRNLSLKTPNSNIQGYYAMRYPRFPAFEDYIEEVRMQAALQRSSVASADIAYFAPPIRRLGNFLWNISGEVEGPVTDLRGRNLNFTDGYSTLHGDLSIRGLPDADNAFFLLQNGTLNTSGPQLIRYIPPLRDAEGIHLETLSRIVYRGSFAGQWHHFLAKGELATNLGNLRSDVNMTLNAAGGAAYEGVISTAGFRLGPLLGVPGLGVIALQARVQGTGFNPAEAQAVSEATISQLQYNGYTYRGITADGSWGRKRFDGKLLVDDPNLALAFYGTADFSGPQPAIIATANLLNANFQPLGLTRDSIHASADLDLDISGSNADNFLGTARLYNINLMRDTLRMDVDSLYLHSGMVVGGKELLLQSNFAQAIIRGEYQLSSLGTASLAFLSGYLPNYFSLTKKKPAPQNLTFDIRTYEMDSLLAVVWPAARGFADATLSGALDTRAQRLDLTANLPYAAIGGVALRGLNIQGSGNYKNIQFQGAAQNISLADSALTLTADVNAVLGQDSLEFHIATTSPQAYGTANINGRAYARKDTVFAALQPSEFYLNGVRWEIPAGSEGAFTRRYLYIDNLFLRSDSQTIAIHALGDSATADIQGLKIGTLNALLNNTQFPLSGLATGALHAAQIFDAPLLSARMLVKNARLGEDTLGNINVDGSYDTRSRLFSLSPQTGLYRDGGWITASGDFDLDTSVLARQGTIQLYNAPVSLVQPFVEGMFSGLQGRLTGALQVTGELGNRPQVSGSARLEGASMHVDYTGVTYALEPAEITLSDYAITLPDITVRDRFGNTGLLNGSVRHDHLSRFSFGLRLHTDGMEALHLASYENDIFYGDVMARADLTVSGPLDNILMNIQATPSGPSRLYMPLGGSTQASPTSYSFLTFRSEDKESTTRRKSVSRFTLNLDAIATPDLEFSLILDPITGDEIYATGSGSIRLELPAAGDPRIYGAYNIDDGRYTFTFRQLIYKRTFDITSGSRISFSGPIDQTELAVNGRYRTRASLYELLTKLEKEALPKDQADDTRRVQDVDVLLTMTGHLDNPNLSFKLELPEKRSVGTAAYNKLEQINQSGDRSLYEQVASLLLIGYFFPPEGLESGSSAISGGVNNLSEILSTNASGQLTNVVNKLLNDPKLSIDLKYKNYNLDDGTSLNPVNRNEVKLGLRRNFFNDRLVLEVGSAYDWGRPTANNTNAYNFNPVGDFRAQYAMNPQGTLQLKAFSLSSYDAIVDRNVNRRGIGIAWRKSFDSVSEFFKGRK